jgi:predicted transcriptional regulator
MKLHKWSDLKKESKIPATRMKEIDEEIAAEVMEMNLRKLRESVGLTQVELAARLESAQPQLSQLEGQSDFKLSTLRRYVQALGGELKVQAILGGKTIELVV